VTLAVVGSRPRRLSSILSNGDLLLIADVDGDGTPEPGGRGRR
jgi:hypothetical protein